MHLLLNYSHIEYLSVAILVNRVHSLLQFLLAQPILEFTFVFCLRCRLVEVCVYYALIVPEFEGRAQIFAVLAFDFELGL